MCPDCQRLADGWLNYRAIPPLKIMQSGGTTPRLVDDANRARAEDHYRLMARQLEAIRRRCAQQHTVALSEHNGQLQIEVAA